MDTTGDDRILLVCPRVSCRLALYLHARRLCICCIDWLLLIGCWRVQLQPSRWQRLLLTSLVTHRTGG